MDISDLIFIFLFSILLYFLLGFVLFFNQSQVEKASLNRIGDYYVLALTIYRSEIELGETILSEKPLEEQKNTISEISVDPLDASELNINGAPTITTGRIREILQTVDSPAVLFSDVFYNEGVNFNVDPAIALAFFKQESNYGTKGIAVNTNSIGNRRVPRSCYFDQENCKLSMPDGGRCDVSCSDDACDFVHYSKINGFYCGYDSWEKSIRTWYELISGRTYVGAGLTTIDKIIPKYCPASDCGGEEGVQDYIYNVKVSVSNYRGKEETVVS